MQTSALFSKFPAAIYVFAILSKNIIFLTESNGFGQLEVTMTSDSR